MNDNIQSSISIESKLNSFYYPIFDLDNLTHFNLFEKLYSPNSYVLFRSSENHYWGIVDAPYKKITTIFNDFNWKICNDLNYVNFCKSYNRLPIRALYENKNRKPRLYKIHGNLSKNFQLFIDNLCIYYNKEGLELSVLKYKNPEMLIHFNRKLKLKNIKNNVKK
jgi:hypothetical protein